MPPVYDEIKFFYEILMRFSDHPDNRGELNYALLRTKTVTTKDGVQIAIQDNEPEQLALVEGDDGQKLDVVLDKANMTTIVANQTLNAALKTAKENAVGLNTLLDQANGHVSSLQAEVERLNGLIASSPVKALETEVAMLRARLAELQPVEIPVVENDKSE